MTKLTKLANTFLLIAAFLLLFNGITPVAHAAFSNNRQTTSDQVVEVDFSEDAQQLKLTKGKNYLISCPASGEGWQISEIRFSIKQGTWLLFDEDTENEYINVEKCLENEVGKVQMFIKCKSTNLLGLKVGLENEITGEKKGYAFALTVSDPQSTSDSHFVLLQPIVPPDEWTGTPGTPPDEGTDNPSTPPDEGTDNPSTPPDEGTDDPSVPPDEGSDNPDTPPTGGDEGGDKEDETPVTPPPIIIDTTGWSFDSITTVYDGQEYTVEVTGLPDYVTPVYTNNTRTNAGTSMAHVSFLVPEGYATPDDMETTITIEKAPLCVINDKNLVETADGKLQFLIPDGALPDGVSYTYTINDIVADDDSTIANKGMYIVNTQFELSEDFPEDMKENYITDSSVIYNVLDHEDVTPSEYGLNFVLELEQVESQNPDEVRVTVSIKFDSTSGRNSVLTYRPVFDSSVLSYVGSELPEGMGAGKINAQGIVSAYTDSFGLLNDGPLTTFIFKVNEGADVTNLPFTVTEVSGVWIAPDPSVIDKSTSYSAAIVLNPSVDTEQYTVMLPPPAGTQTTTLTGTESSSNEDNHSATSPPVGDELDVTLPKEESPDEFESDVALSDEKLSAEDESNTIPSGEQSFSQSPLDTETIPSEDVTSTVEATPSLETISTVILE